VHATLESGTEMLIAGRPLTLGDFVTVEVAHDANTTPATEHTTRSVPVNVRGRILDSLLPCDRDDRCRCVDATD